VKEVLPRWNGRRDCRERQSARGRDSLRAGAPVISVDTKKKKIVGEFKNPGREWHPIEGWVNVGADHDTPAFAVRSIADWWRHMGKKAYPNATELLQTADTRGSNGYCLRLWKVELQRFATRTGLNIAVSPPCRLIR
jgi:hypothetical protein